MSDNGQEKKKSTLTLGSKLSLPAGAAAGGRSGRSSVTVEVRKKRRSFAADGSQTPAEQATTENAQHEVAQEDLSGLTASERAVRMEVLKRAAEEDKRAAEEAAKRAEEERLRKEEEAKRAAEKAAEEASQKAEESKNAAPAEKTEGDVSAIEAQLVRPIKSSERLSGHRDAEKEVKEAKEKEKEKERDAKQKVRRGEDKRRSNKLTITQALEQQEEKFRSLASIKRARAKAKRASGLDVSREKQYREVQLPETITVQELANRMSERVADVIKFLMKMDMMVTANQTIDADTAELVAVEMGHSVKRVTEADVEKVLTEEQDDTPESLQPRAPIVTIMGHVDHGKTSLLDAVRETNVASGEAGGITQHIGAYQVHTPDGHEITFIDTPGHEAFTAMRSRGAKVTDIVILVVAADDGIMAQTIEAINHAKAAGVPIIVAVNKIDKPGADPQRIRNELLQHELVSEEMGGDILVVDVSAKQRLHLDKLLEAVLLQAEVLELKANPDRRATGVVIESKVEKGRGVISTLLVQRGTLAIGSIVVAGSVWGKVRAMRNAQGESLSKAGPSVPVEVLGISEPPQAGDEFAVVDSEKAARDIAEYRGRRERDLKVAAEKRGSLEELFQKTADGGLKELPIIIKADVQGSAEAIIGSLDKVATEEVRAKVLHSAVGGINESDIALARASKALVLAFNVRASAEAKQLAEKEGVEIRYYSIIYDLVDDMKALLGGLLSPTIREIYLGNAEIREIFNMSKYGKVAGCYVTDGMIKRGAGVRLLRDNVVIHEGKLKTLRRFKDDVKEVGTNFECGMAFENYEDMKVGDVIEAFETVEEQRAL